MKTENDFNAFLSSEFKRYLPGISALKTSDKYQIGLPDFIIWGYGLSAGVESKFILDFPKRKGTKVLKHPFKRDQISKLKEIDDTLNRGYGIVGVKKNKIIYVFDVRDIPYPSGNWTYEEFTTMAQTKAKLFEFGDIEAMLEYILNYKENSDAKPETASE